MRPSDHAQGRATIPRRGTRLGRVDCGQRAYIDDFWDRAEFEIEGGGDTELPAAGLRGPMSPCMQAGARAEQARDPSRRGWTGQRLRRDKTSGEHRGVLLPMAHLHRCRNAARDALVASGTRYDLDTASGSRARFQGRGVSLADDPRAGSAPDYLARRPRPHSNIKRYRHAVVALPSAPC